MSVISANRNPDSIVAGGLPVARSGQRVSHDLDLFHARTEALQTSSTADMDALNKAGFDIKITRSTGSPNTTFIQAEVSQNDAMTTIEWVIDSDYRFFPVIPDDEFGFVLNPIDLGINKVLAVAGRSELRDIIDLNQIAEKYLPLGPLVAAAIAIDPGYTPELLLNELMRQSRRSPDEYAAVEGIDSKQAVQAVRNFREKIHGAAEFVNAIPTPLLGRIFLEDGRPIQPDTQKLSDYETHSPKQAGHWPSAPGIQNAMLAERHGLAWDKAPH